MEFLKIGDQEIEVLELWESEKARLYRRLDDDTIAWIPHTALTKLYFNVYRRTSKRIVKAWYSEKINWKQNTIQTWYSK